VGAWEVLVLSEMGCALRSGFQDGAVLSLGFVSGTGGAFLSLSHPSWSGEISENAEYPLTFQWDEAPAWTATGTGVAAAASGPGFLYVGFNEAEFLLEFARSQRLVVRIEGSQLADLRFQDNSRALEELLRCQEVRFGN
jgi:hypothetical protein